MSDIEDFTQTIEDQILNMRLANRIRYGGESAMKCAECSEEIEQGRRLAIPGVKLCVECAVK